MSDAADSTPTLYEWAGGEAALRRLIDAFYDRVERDELLSPFFPGGVHEAHRDHVTAWWAEVFGGPSRYTDELGGYESMLAHHRDLGITPEARHRFASLFSLAADDAGLPDDPEFRSALVAYLEWGTRLALANSQPGAEPSRTLRSRAGAGARPRRSTRAADRAKRPLLVPVRQLRPAQRRPLRPDHPGSATARASAPRRATCGPTTPTGARPA